MVNISMFHRKVKHDTLFTVNAQVSIPPSQPIEEEELYSDEEDAPVIVRPKKSKKDRLPGMKLLKQLHKMRIRESTAD